jgi:hypothetical protein
LTRETIEHIRTAHWLYRHDYIDRAGLLARCPACAAEAASATAMTRKPTEDADGADA